VGVVTLALTTLLAATIIPVHSSGASPTRV